MILNGEIEKVKSPRALNLPNFLMIGNVRCVAPQRECLCVARARLFAEPIRKSRILMRNKASIIVAVIMQVLLAVAVCSAQEFKIDENFLAKMRFPSPENLAAKKYLGLSDAPEFSLGQIKAEYVLLEIFSMYCPICQKDAPHVNQLFELVQGDQNLKNRVKFLGIGTGNTPYEVEVFQKKFKIQFPMISDDNFGLQKISSHDIRTPTFVVLRIKDKNQLEIVKTKVGEIKDSQEFFKSVALLMAQK